MGNGEWETETDTGNEKLLVEQKHHISISDSRGEEKKKAEVKVLFKGLSKP